MEHWVIDSGRGGASLDAAAAAAVVACIGSAERTALAAAMLALARRVSAARCCTIFCFEAERGPRLLSGAHCGDAWGVLRTAARYTREFSAHDGVRAALRAHGAGLPPAAGAQAPQRLLLHRQRAAQLAHAGYREACYDSQGVGERLAVLARVGPDCWLATHL